MFVGPEDSGQVTVEIDDSESTCTSYIREKRKEPFTATLTATPAAGFEFSGWRICTATCDDAGASTSLTVEVNRDIVEVNAEFSEVAPAKYTLQVSVDPAGAGEVLLDGTQLPVYPCTQTETSPFTSTLEAVAGDGYAFESWSGSIPESSDNPLDVPVTEGGETVSAIANFVEAPAAGVKGDFTGDGEVGLEDFVAFAQAYGCSDEDACYDATGDFNDDGQIDMEDFAPFTHAYNARV